MPAKTRQDARRRLVAMAGEQSGYFSAAQALEAGYSYQAQKYHADQGNWHRVDRGIFRLPEWPVGQHEDLVRWTLWSTQRAVVSHDTALSVHGLGDVNPARVHLTVPAGFRAKAPELVLHTGVLERDDVEHHEGFRVTTPLRSVLDVASGHLDLDQLRTALTDALDRGLVTQRSLLARADAFGPHTALRIERALRGNG